MQAFIERGGSAIFFPPRLPGSSEFLGAAGPHGRTSPRTLPVESWRGDQDLLAHTQSGMPLPVGALQIRKYCGLLGEFTPLATLKGGAPLLARVTTNRGARLLLRDHARSSGTRRWRPAASSSMSWCNARWPRERPSWGARDSSWPASRLGTIPRPGSAWPAPRKPCRPSTRFTAGSTKRTIGCSLSTASAAEESAPVLGDSRVAALFRGLDFARVDDQAGSLGSLIQEIWRMFLTAMMVAMVVEAALCLPKVAHPRGAAS